MDYFYITGTSRGIGKALAQELLSRGAKVFGFARSCSIEHKNYVHLKADFSNISAIKEIDFYDHADANRIVLINNAGTLGQIKHIGNIESSSIEESFNINIISPAILINKFVKRYKDLHGVEKIVLNISSGAGQNEYDGWSCYCSTKAALDMFSKVLNKEQELSGKNFKVLAVSPGIIATNMQEQIRSSNKQDFSLHENFVGFYNNDQLKDPATSAQELLKVLEKQIEGVLLDLRDV